MMEKRNNRE